MNILLVHYPEIDNCPPVKSLINNLRVNGHNVTVISRDRTDSYSKKEGLNFIKIKSSNDDNIVASLMQGIRNKFWIKRTVRKEMTHNDVLWTVGDTTVRALGTVVLKYKHIMELLELIEDIPLFPMQNLFKLGISRYAKKAWKVVVPEYNRSQITRVWWNLDCSPIVLPNKPYDISIKELDSSYTTIIKQMAEDTRIKVLYQGSFGNDRLIDKFASAIENNSQRYCLYMMGRENEYSNILCNKYKSIRFIPFIPAPQHLNVTRLADIGLLTYIPQKVAHYSELNALYCAPNKIYEFSAFGIPMIGTDVPGLRYPFDKYGIGFCCESLDDESIVSKLDMIVSEMNVMKHNCSVFFQEENLDEIVNIQILETNK